MPELVTLVTRINDGEFLQVSGHLSDQDTFGPNDPLGSLQRYAVVLDVGLIGCLVQYRGCRGPLLIITEPR